MRPYSNDLRERVFGEMEEGASSLEAAARFGVSESFARKLRLRFQRFGTLAPGPWTQGRKREFLPEHDELLRQLAGERPDATNAELAQGIAKQMGRLFSPQTISAALKRLGFTRKKRRSMRASSIARTSNKRGPDGWRAGWDSWPIGCCSSTRAGSISR
jgi:transposase